VLFLLSWQAIFRLSNIALDIAFKFFAIFLNKLYELSGAASLKEIALFFQEH
jgi:hypothetical protein